MTQHTKNIAVTAAGASVLIALVAGLCWLFCNDVRQQMTLLELRISTAKRACHHFCGEPNDPVILSSRYSHEHGAFYSCTCADGAQTVVY